MIEVSKNVQDPAVVEDLLKSFKTMNIDLVRDLTEAAKQRKIQSNQWQDLSQSCHMQSIPLPAANTSPQ